MKKGFVLALASIFAASAFSSASSRADEAADAKMGLHDESEVGVVITSGNSSTESLNFNQKNSYLWDLNTLKFTGKYLKTTSNDVDTARSWFFGLRYERELSDRFSIFVGQSLDSDVFSGIIQRYNTDVGGKYALYKETDFVWNLELGYRYSVENRFSGQKSQHYLRAYTEANKDWTKTASTKASMEYLPNLSETSDFQLNTELSASAALSEVFAIKVGYLVKFRKLPPPPAAKKTDTQFTTALVAKF